MGRKRQEKRAALTLNLRCGNENIIRCNNRIARDWCRLVSNGNVGLMEIDLAQIWFVRQLSLRKNALCRHYYSVWGTSATV